MEKPRPFQVGDRVEVVRKGTVRHAGVVIDTRIEGDTSGYSADVEILRIQLDGLGVRAFTRTISSRGVTSDWQARAKDMKKIGALRIRPAVKIDEDDLDAIEDDAVREMGGDDFVAYEQATGKQIGNK